MDEPLYIWNAGSQLRTLRAEVESLRTQLAGEGHDRCEKACVCYDDGYKHAKGDLAAVRMDLSEARRLLNRFATGYCLSDLLMMPDDLSESERALLNELSTPKEHDDLKS